MLPLSLVKWLSIAAISAGFVGAASTANASDVRPSLDIARLAKQSAAWIESQKRPNTVVDALALTPPRERDRAFYPRPRISIVARDWNQSITVGGSDRLVMDRVRLSRSTRMMFARARLELDRLVPYAQAGLGQWRPDRDAVTLLLADTENAAQLGAGAEFRVAPRGALALECDYTMFYRETHEPQFIAPPQVLAGFAVMRVEF